MSIDREWLETRIRTVLLATDFQQNSRLALEYAAAFARHLDAELVILNAFQFGPHSQTVEIVSHVPSRERRDAEEQLEAFTSGAGELGVSGRHALIEGLVPSAILEGILQYHADLLVIGTQGIHRGLNHLLLGSNTEALMLRSPRPTLTVGPHVYGGFGSSLAFKKIIYVSDFSVTSAAAAQFAQALGETFGAEVEIYQLPHGADHSESMNLQRAATKYCAALASVVPAIEKQWRSPDFQLSRIHAEADLRARLTDTSNLIVLGVQPASYLGRHLHTSLAYRILANAASPVLTIPAGCLNEPNKV
jgi:nucleotide-binding universal stress UspA family protein